MAAPAQPAKRMAVMSVELSATDASLRPASPKALFQTPLIVQTNIDQYAVRASVDRFLMPVSIEGSRPTLITVILNWRPPH
jgi:hypothetical protein